MNRDFVFKAFIMLSMFLILATKVIGDLVLYKELSLIAGHSNENGWLDKLGMVKNGVGIEYFGKLSSDKGDFLTFDLQTQLTYDFSEDFKHAWDIVTHNAWLEYKLGLGKSLRAGHFDPSFGLEPILDTHSKLLQTMIHKNIGFDKDWGVSYRSMISQFDYEISLQNGSGMKIKRDDGNFLLTGRIGKAGRSNFLYGLSLLYGKILRSEEMHDSSGMDMLDGTILKKRIGLDSQYAITPFLLKSELAYGKNDDMDVIGLFLETDYTPPSLQSLELQLQLQRWQEDMMTDTMLILGTTYKLTSKINIRAAYIYNIDKDRQIFIQFHYYGI